MTDEVVEMNKQVEDNKTYKISGWLIVIALFVLYDPLRSLHSMLTTYPATFSSGNWAAFTDKSGPAYLKFYDVVLITEIIVSFLFFLAYTYIAILFFMKKYKFKFWYLSVILLSFFWVFLNPYILSIIVPNYEIMNSDTLKYSVRIVVIFIMVVPYIFRSKLAKLVFIR
jgi:hypothetical protein